MVILHTGLSQNPYRKI